MIEDRLEMLQQITSSLEVPCPERLRCLLGDPQFKSPSLSQEKSLPSDFEYLSVSCRVPGIKVAYH